MRGKLLFLTGLAAGFVLGGLDEHEIKIQPMMLKWFKGKTGGGAPSGFDNRADVVLVFLEIPTTLEGIDVGDPAVVVKVILVSIGNTRQKAELSSPNVGGAAEGERHVVVQEGVVFNGRELT